MAPRDLDTPLPDSRGARSGLQRDTRRAAAAKSVARRPAARETPLKRKVRLHCSARAAAVQSASRAKQSRCALESGSKLNFVPQANVCAKLSYRIKVQSAVLLAQRSLFLERRALSCARCAVRRQTAAGDRVWLADAESSEETKRKARRSLPGGSSEYYPFCPCLFESMRLKHKLHGPCFACGEHKGPRAIPCL
jgi:hypothetical protein